MATVWATSKVIRIISRRIQTSVRVRVFLFRVRHREQSGTLQRHRGGLCLVIADFQIAHGRFRLRYFGLQSDRRHIRHDRRLRFVAGQTQVVG